MKDTLLKIASEIYPDAIDYIVKVANDLSVEDREELIFSNNAILEDAIEQISKNDELLKEANATPTFGQSAKNFAKGIGATALTGISIAVLNDLVQNAYSAATKDRNFNKMIEYAPDLKNYDQKKVKAIFDSLHELSGPKVTGLPHIASDFVRQHSELPGGLSNPKNLSDLVGIRRNIEDRGHIQQPKDIPHYSVERQDSFRENRQNAKEDRANRPKTAKLTEILKQIRSN